jgi:hypothetical protein
MKGKKSFTVYCDWLDIFEAIPDEQAGQLIKHVLRYVNDQDPEPDNQIVALLFIQMKQTLKRDLQKWKERAERSRLNGLKGGRPVTQKTQRVISKPRKPDTVTDTVTVITVTDTDTVTDIKEKSKPKRSRFTPPHIEELKNYFFEKLQSKDLADHNAEKFFDFYASKGWMVGRNKMKDWRAAVRNWD